MKKSIIKMTGIGTGAGEELEVIAREDVEKIIDDLDVEEVVKKAMEVHNPGWQYGKVVLNIRTGKVYAYAMDSCASNHAIDDQEVILVQLEYSTTYTEEDLDWLELNDYIEENLNVLYSEIVK